ncbi:presenilin enhancer-2 subunit of gamma secretase [Nitzschia inconspicua]|uniref:Presenilin enhancer-2 subunit of gamma secretase n=1 Tax=Nitzschia inconspicua TaxID=303405 RepID=A0A9K3KGD3_9STRA|nr:presenilin enhancer-2 subunit of gamma secretase [Nitzschia inconspicua]
MSNPPNQIEDFELSKRYYYAGLLGLPWLWIVHTINWHGKKKSIVRPDQTAEQVENSRKEDAWVKQCRRSAIVVTIAWIIWVLLVQVILRDRFPSSWFVRYDDTSEATGW